MKIPVKIHKTIIRALILQNEYNFDAYTDLRIRKAEERKIENAFKWLRKYKRKQKPPKGGCDNMSHH